MIDTITPLVEKYFIQFLLLHIFQRLSFSIVFEGKYHFYSIIQSISFLAILLFEIKQVKLC